MDTLQDYREPTHDERYGSGDTEMLDRIYSTLKDRGYTLLRDLDMDELVLHQGERDMLAYPSDRGLELTLFDDFSNPFGVDDFATIDEYVSALIARFDELCHEYAKCA